MTVSTIIIVIICFSVIIHHLYKVKDELNDIKEKLNEISNYQIDGCVEDIEDKVDGAKWADETMIEKACSWLDRALDNFYIGTHQANFADKVKFIESFKKAMRNNYGRFCNIRNSKETQREGL